jgi:hypothetical protein
MEVYLPILQNHTFQEPQFKTLFSPPHKFEAPVNIADKDIAAFKRVIWPYADVVYPE